MSVTLVTAQGKQAIANAIANNTTVKITKIAVGDGNGTVYTPTESQTALRNKKWEGTLNSAIINPANVNEIIFEGRIAVGVGGFYIREVGLFDENNVLIGVSDFPESFKAAADQYEVFVRMTLKVASTNAIVNVNNDLVFATQKYVDDAVKTKVEKVDGKSLSTNDYTTDEQTQVANLKAVFATMQKKKITADDGSALYTIGSTLPTLPGNGVFSATGSNSGSYRAPKNSIEGIIFAESNSYWNFIGLSDDGTIYTATRYSTWKGWKTYNDFTDAEKTNLANMLTDFTTHKSDSATHNTWVTCATASADTAKIGVASGFALATGSTVRVKFTNANTADAPTLNVNSTGAKALKKADGSAFNKIVANGVYTFVYDGTSFISQAEGGEYGTATASDVIAGKTIGTENGLVEGIATISTLGGVLGAQGTFSADGNIAFTVNGLNFTPRLIFLFYRASEYVITYTYNTVGTGDGNDRFWRRSVNNNVKSMDTIGSSAISTFLGGFTYTANATYKPVATAVVTWEAYA